MRNILVVLSALGVVLGVIPAGPGRAADAEPPLTQHGSRNDECTIATAAIKLKLAPSSGMQLAYGSEVPDDKGVTEGSWTPRISVPFLREFDARHHISAIPLCAALRAELDALGARLVEGRALDNGQWGLAKSERTAVLRVTLPILSADGTRAMVRVEAPCGWGCGSGDTYEFVREGENWKQNAIRVEWSGTVYFDRDGRQSLRGR